MGFFFLLCVCPTHVRSQVFSGLVLRLCGSEVILQEGLKVLKSVPFIGLPPPALQHQFMKRGRAAWSAGHPVAPLHLLQHFTVVHAYRGRGGRQGCQYRSEAANVIKNKKHMKYAIDNRCKIKRK